jgi:membrane-bound ClpP family serine protease
VQVKGELWRARSTSAEPLAEGATVRILALEDLTLVVEPVPD